MKTSSSLFALVVSSTAFFTSGSAGAVDMGGMDIGIQPRLEIGAMNYKYKQGALSNITPSTATQFGRTVSQSSFTFQDTMFALTGGLTLFADRFFLDLNGTWAMDGQDSTIVETSEFREIEEDGELGYRNTTFSPEYRADFDREDYAVTLGYGVSDQLSLFAGYKWANTNFNTNYSGPLVSFTNFSGVTDSGTIFGTYDFEFKYDGPFVGAAYAYNIDQGFLSGKLGFNMALAFLNGEVKQKSRTANFDPDGAELPFEVKNPDSFAAISFRSKGDTTGVTVGINWRGFTPIENLTYLVGINWYQYNFDAEEQLPDITETVLNFKVGIAYLF